MVQLALPPPSSTCDGVPVDLEAEGRKPSCLKADGWQQIFQRAKLSVELKHSPALLTPPACAADHRSDFGGRQESE
jgi:hypothetical protein